MGMNRKRINSSAFFQYINSPLKPEVMTDIFNKNKVNLELCELYFDFIVSLIVKVFESYLGDDIMDEKAREEHYRWAIETVKQNFLAEGISFYNRELVDDYFLEFLNEMFYYCNEKSEESTEEVFRLIEYMFNPNVSKTQSEVDTFIGIYNIMDNSLKKR